MLRECLRENGCANNGRIYHPEVWSPEEAHNVDLLVVALKYGSLEGTLKSIQNDKRRIQKIYQRKHSYPGWCDRYKPDGGGHAGRSVSGGMGDGASAGDS